MTTLARADLRADCANCLALCCTLLGFSRSADFPVDKPAGAPCPNLTPAHSCGIHDRLRGRGYHGCVTFDCFGAGQSVSRDPGRLGVFPQVRQLHEMLWHLADARARAYGPDLAEDAAALAAEIGLLLQARTMPDASIAGLHSRVRELLIEVSAELRAPYSSDPTAVGGWAARSWVAQSWAVGGSAAGGSRAGDWAGADLRRVPLRGADLRGACLIGADLRGVDLTAVDLLGADLRGAKLGGADLSTALFLTQGQANSALGDPRTLLPADLDAPGHWG